MKNRKKLVSILAGIMAAIMLLSLLFSLIPVRASAASSSEIRKQINGLKDQKSELKAQMEELKKQYQANEDEISDIVARKNVIDQEIGLLHAQILNINEQISAFGVLIADKQDELDNAQERFDKLSDEYKVRIRAMEEEGSISYWEVLFKANSFSDLLDRLNMVEEIAASDNRRLQELNDATQAVAQAQNDLELEKADLEATKQELDATQAELDDKRAEADAVIKELVDKSIEIEGMQSDLEKEDQLLIQQIADMEKAYNEAKHQEWLEYMATYTTVPPAPTAPSNGGNNGGGSSGGGSGGGTWLRPCSYVYMSSPFGLRQSPTSGASTFHKGVDLAAPAGTPIYASRAGVVTIATYSNSAGYYVTINHGDGYSSIYMHMTNYVVSAGSAVSAGQLIGYVGSTGISTGNHLHFGIAYNGAYINPCNFLSF